MFNDLTENELDTLMKINTGSRYDGDVHSLRQQKIIQARWISRLCGLKSTHTVLDYGAGFGFIAEEIKKKVRKVYTFEPDQRFRYCCKSLGLDEYNGESIDVTIMKDVTETFDLDHFNNVLAKLDTKLLFFTFIDKNNHSVNDTFLKNKNKYSQQEIEDLAKRHNFKILLKHKEPTSIYHCVLMRKIIQ